MYTYVCIFCLFAMQLNKGTTVDRQTVRQTDKGVKHKFMLSVTLLYLFFLLLLFLDLSGSIWSHFL